MLFWIGKSQERLFDSSAILTLKPGNLNNQFDLSTADRKCLKNPMFLAELDDVAGFTVRTFQIIRVNAAMNNCLAAKKSVFLYCTPEIPNV